MSDPNLDNPYTSAFSTAARSVLTEHYETGANLYKFWGSPGSVLSALFLGWARSNHPGHLSYAWNLESARSLDEGIRATTKQAVSRMGLEGNTFPRIFEAGCGIGGCTLEVAAQFPRGHITGLAIVHRQLEIARERARAQNIKNAEFVCGNFLKTPFPGEHYDAIFAMECIAHTPEEERCALLREWRRILKPGGHIVIFDGFSLRHPANEEERQTIRDVMEGWTFPYPPRPEVFKSQAEESGLRVLEQTNTTAHVYESARRIAAIAMWVLRPLSWLACVPLLGGIARPLGFESARHAALFVRACRAQQRLFEQNLGAYFVYVFERI